MDPVRLTMMSMRGLCMFCTTPEEETRTKHVCLETHYGFYSCGKGECTDRLFSETDDWWRDKSYGDVYYLKNNRDIKITRSNGYNENGWSIISPLVLKDSYGHDIVYCTSTSSGLERWCKVDMLLYNNPGYVSRAYKNLCIECGTDMGTINPRQFCGKYMCNKETIYYETPEKVEDEKSYIAYQKTQNK